MNPPFSIKSNKKKVQSSAVSSLFTGETESAREKLQRQQIATDLNYGFEVSNTEVDPEEAALGDIYDIDNFLEEKEERQKKEEQSESFQQKKKEKKPSKYIAILKQRAEERKREMDIIYEKNKIKEREKEDAMYEGKEKFITNAYKRKLEADRKWLDDVRKREEQKNNKSTFLTHLLNSRVDEPEKKEKEEEFGKSEQLGKPEQPEQQSDSDEFDGFILAPPEEQIKGNVEMSDDDDAGLIMQPKEDQERSTNHSRDRSRSRSYNNHSRDRDRSRSYNHSRDRSRSRSYNNHSRDRSRSYYNHSHHRHNHSHRSHHHHH